MEESGKSAPGELRVYTTHPTGRKYVDLADLSRLCAIPARDLDLKYRPISWACPRDFRWEHGRMWFAVASLPELVESLSAAGESAAALSLGKFSEENPAVIAPNRATGESTAAVSRPVSGADARAQWEKDHE